MKKIDQRLFLLSFILMCSYSFLFSCTSKHPIEKQEGSFISIDSTNKVDSLTGAMIAPYSKKVQAMMNEVVAVSEQVLLKDQPEGLLGDLTADIILQKARDYSAKNRESKDSLKVDLCVLNSSLLRFYLPKGSITRGAVYHYIPYDYEMVILTLPGEEVKELFDFIANKGGMPVAGMRMKITNNMADEVLIGGRPFDISKQYSVVTTDRLANGGDNMTFFLNSLKKTNTEIKIRDAVIESLSEDFKKGNTIKVKTDGRIQITE
jgi:2',3'-cyclic-nucleotide 2'-phosphodiesterase (5'-nucleotidase family)